MTSLIKSKFLSLRAKGKKAFIPYIMAGYPSAHDTLRYFSLLEQLGADIVELGVPFTDPLADGPVIQAASEEALKRGINLTRVLAMVEEIRKTSSLPIVLMTYYNPVFKYGEEAFVRDAVKAGVNGVIIPDLPPDEAISLRRLSRQAGLDTIFLAAPTSTDERLRLIARASTGFIYYVSLTGITGARLHLDGSQKAVIDRIRSFSKTPVATGFGVSTPEEAARVAEFSDGVIIGSAIVKRLLSDDRELREYISSLADAIHDGKVEAILSTDTGLQ
ncbi:MAG: tryptophan synthase subunit alpha [Thermodesulfovibrionales bacterium]|nr:tryptophan synthase subunit alpha [Thermodesulfovibrionales bacterium]